MKNTALLKHSIFFEKKYWEDLRIGTGKFLSFNKVCTLFKFISSVLLKRYFSLCLNPGKSSSKHWLGLNLSILEYLPWYVLSEGNYNIVMNITLKNNDTRRIYVDIGTKNLKIHYEIHWSLPKSVKKTNRPKMLYISVGILRRRGGGLK